MGPITANKRRSMNKNRKLREKRTIEVEGNLSKAVCGVEIYNAGSEKFEVVLCKPDVADYKGVSTTNNFENFANQVKATYLPDTPAQNITWKDRMQFQETSMPDFEAKVLMDFDGSRFSNPQWVKGVSL